MRRLFSTGLQFQRGGFIVRQQAAQTIANTY
ncbi:hypothetical protein DM52_1380 [Burkholderia mallei]|nr:hypothetical protein DM52_1380 [Burkholderia mallei]